MKKPTLRFRQVFEHPTHFKVTRPLGNPIKIAKQGLSPNLMARLRKFAEGGETPEPTEQDQQNFADLEAEVSDTPRRRRPGEPGIESGRPRSRRPEMDKVAGKEDFSSDVFPPLAEPTIPETYRKGVMANAMMIEDAAERAQFIRDRINEYNAAMSAEPDAEAAKPRPRPTRRSIVEATPVDETVQPQPFPEIVRADQVEQAPVGMMGVPVMGPPSPRITQPEPLKSVAVEPVAEAAPKTRPRPVRPGVTAEAAAPTAEAVTAEAPAAAVSGVQADVAATPVAPAVAPSVATSEFVLPKGFDVGKPLTVEAYRAAKDANKGRSDQEIALGLIRQYAPNAEPPPDFDKLLTPPPEGASEDTLKKFDAAKDDLARAIVNQAKVDYDTNKQLLVANERAQAQRLINAEKDRATADALVARRDALAKAVEGGFKPESLYGGNLAAQIGSALSIAAGAFASGMTGMPNFALKIYESAVDRDLEVQKAKYNSLVNQYNRLLGDADDAEKLARADLNDLAALQVEGIKASSKMRGVAPAADQMIADLRAKATKEREEVALKQAQAREAEVKAELAEPLAKSLVNQRNAAGARAAAANNLAALRAGQAERRLNLAELRDQFKRDTQANAIKFSVPDPVDPSKMISVNAPSVTEANKARSKILNRATALQRVEQLSDFMNKPRMIGDKIDPKFIKDVQVRLASVIENYPSLSKGTEQMVTQAQAMLLKDSASDIPLPAVRWADVLGLTSRAVDYLRKDGADGLANAVAMHAREGDPGREEFKRKFGPEGYGGKTAIVESAAAPSVPAGYTALRNPQSGKVQAVPNDKAKAAMAAGWTVP